MAEALTGSPAVLVGTATPKWERKAQYADSAIGGDVCLSVRGG